MCTHFFLYIPLGHQFLVFFPFFEKKYLLLSYATFVRPSVRRAVRRLSSVEIISFCGILISNWPINLKIGLIVRWGVVHVGKALFLNLDYKLQIYATYDYLQIKLCARF